MKYKISCPCSGSFTKDINEEINLDNNPELLDEILNGTFLSFLCSNCGKRHKPEFPLLVLWPGKNLKLEVLPELDRGEFYRRKKDTANTETIISYPELADRLSVIRDGLEPIVIEAIKYYLLLRAEETYPDLRISAWYHSVKNSSTDNSGYIEFHLHGIKADEVAVSRVPYSLYNNKLMEFKKKPRSELFTSLKHRSYLSVNNMLKPEGL